MEALFTMVHAEDNELRVEGSHPQTLLGFVAAASF